jgi:myo-inositol 2-dehydrogenase/D-chiro-inositol 1-dehydrogenase
MVTPEGARRVMETYLAADLSAARNAPIDLPLSNETMSAIADMTARSKT